MRVVLDAKVLVSAAISAAGPPRRIISAWVDERFELIASPALLEELSDVLARPRFRRFISIATAGDFIDGLAEDAEILDDPPTISSPATGTCSTSQTPTRRCSPRASSSTCSARDYAAGAA